VSFLPPKDHILFDIFSTPSKFVFILHVVFRRLGCTQQEEWGKVHLLLLQGCRRPIYPVFCYNYFMTLFLEILFPFFNLLDESLYLNNYFLHVFQAFLSFIKIYKAQYYIYSDNTVLGTSESLFAVISTSSFPWDLISFCG
jgi:hypothetical protein